MKQPNGHGELVFVVSDLRQYAYCPRVVYFRYCLPLVRPVTFKMELGAAAHLEEHQRERRRTLALYGLVEGKRLFDVWVESERLGLRGRIDMVIDLGSGGERELVPVDYKQTGYRPGRHVQWQVAAYGMMLEESWGAPVRRGFVYTTLAKRAHEVKLTPPLRREVEDAVQAMRAMVMMEQMPPPVRQHAKCVSCEFRRFCNDV